MFDLAAELRQILTALLLVVDIDVDGFLEVFGHALGFCDGAAEGHGVFQFDPVFLPLIQQPLPASDDPRCFRDTETAAFLLHGALIDLADGLLIDGQGDHLIIRQQVFVDGSAEGQVIELRAEHLLVVHGGNDIGVGVGDPDGPVAIDTRRSGHIQALFAFYDRIVMHLYEFAGLVLLAFLHHAGGAVSLVTDDEIEGR